MTSDAPWPTISVKMAARKLGVSSELVRGLCADRKIEALKVPSKRDNGHHAWLIRASSVDDLCRQMKRVT